MVLLVRPAMVKFSETLCNMYGEASTVTSEPNIQIQNVFSYLSDSLKHAVNKCSNVVTILC
jgi:hypothetical protein